MTEVLWPDQIHLSTERLWATKNLVQEDANWYIVHRLNHRDKPPRTYSRSREPASVECSKQNIKNAAVEAAVDNDNHTLARKPLETVTLRRLSADVRFPPNGLASHKSDSNPSNLLVSQKKSRQANSVSQTARLAKRRTINGIRKRSTYRKRQIKAAGRELKALIISNERWNWAAIADGSERSCRTLSTEKPVQNSCEVVNSKDIANVVLKRDRPNNTNCGVDVLVPSWRVVETKRRYVIEQTENLDDEVFNNRHQKHELDEKRRKRWDEQRLRDLELLERLHNRKDQTATNSRSEPNTSSACKDVKMTSVSVIEAEPVIAFGHFIAYLPPREFSLPRFLCQQSKSVKFKKPKSSSKF